jgi:hypothetical protein
MSFFIYAFTTLFAFTFMPLVTRYYLRVHRTAPLYRTFTPLFLFGTALASFSSSWLLSSHLLIPSKFVFEVTGLGFLYACATYLLYYAIEYERAGIISALGGAQQLLTAFFQV